MAHNGHTGHIGHLINVSRPLVGDGMGPMDMSMDMYFNNNWMKMKVLFKSWELTSSNDLIVTCIAFFVIAVFYEALKTFREFIFQNHLSKNLYNVSILNSDMSANNGHNGSTSSPSNVGNGRIIGNGGDSTNEDLEIVQPRRAVISSAILSKVHLIQSFLHVIQVATSYFLMLAFMTYNIWICVSILLGAGIGYFTFCWRRMTIVDVNEHCP